MSWNDCTGWLPRLGLVLPTEAQWEYAVRGGTTTVRWTGNGTGHLYEAANMSDPSATDSRKYESIKPVGSLLPNPFGLHDVLGNVWEWCLDEYEYKAEPRAGDGLRGSVELSASPYWVFRGSGFCNVASHARSAVRGYDMPGYRDVHLGVRPARSLDR